MLIVDDGSADNTSVVVAAYTLKDERVKYFYQQNGRQGKARNMALRHAKGSLVAFLDADDLWLPNKLETQLKELASTNADLVFSDSYIFKPGQHTAEYNKIGTITGYLKGAEGLAKMLEINRIPILTVLAKKEAISAAADFTEKREIQNAEDYHLWLKMLLNGNVFYGSSEITTAYRITGHSVTTADRLATSSAVEALYDLARTYPAKAKTIKAYLKKWFAARYYVLPADNKDAFMTLIEKNCEYLSKRMYQSLLKATFRILGVRYFRVIVKHTLNA
jgi:glycosyltransferase involved in cell wall biosynthesis